MSSALSPAVELDDVRLTLEAAAGPVEILRGVTLSAQRGETLALRGASGSGKSSLLMVATGLERPTGGKVRIMGEDITGLDEDALARVRGRHIGIVFQSFHLVPALSALDNVALPLGFLGRRGAPERAIEMLARVGLAGRERHMPSQLSGGEQQRVAIARALAPAPALIFADEPTGNLDAATGTRVADLLFAAAREDGATLVLITHDAALAERCGRVVQVADGRVSETPKRALAGVAAR